MPGYILTAGSAFAFRTLIALVLAAPVDGMGWQLSGQQPQIFGRVVDAETGEPLEGVAVGVAGTEARVPTNQDGRFAISAAAGTHSLVVSRIGYETMRLDGIRAGAGGDAIEVRLRSRSLHLNPVVVTASRTREKALDAPSSVASVSAHEISRVTATVPAQHVRSLPGVDAVRTGLNQHTIVARGFSDVWSGSLLTIVDNRYARIPSQNFNAHHMIPTTDLDIERIEVSLGPGAALYGPNAASGVMHIVTASPIDAPGSTVSLVGGERTVFHGQFRTAHTLGDKLGFKVSGQYFRGRDFEHEDPLEAASARINPDNPLIGKRLPLSERSSVDGRFDWRFGSSSLVVAGGVNRTPASIELSEIGAVQAENWATWYTQARFSSGRLFAQLFHNGNDGGSSYLLRTGEHLVDRSSASGAQVQHGVELGEGVQSFTYGFDLAATTPRTEGTINGRFEDDDNSVEFGGYLHSVTELGRKVDLVVATRVDHHNRMAETNISPRLALVFEPFPEQKFRATLNRAFTTPTTNNLFVDVPVGMLPLGPQSDGYLLRGRGTVDGFSFNDRCASGVFSLCMYSPMGGGRVPANGAVMWDRLVDITVPAELRGLLYGPGKPGDPELVTLLRTLDLVAAQAGAADPFETLTGPPVGADPIASTITNTLEVGYKGILGGRLLVAADLYAARVKNFVGTLRIESPNVFLEAGSVERFVLNRLSGLIEEGTVSPVYASSLARNLAAGALGTVAPDGEERPDLVLSFRNFGDVDYWGSDLAFRLVLSGRARIDANYSYLSEDCFDFNDDGLCRAVQDVAVNAPMHKGSVGVGFDDPGRGVSARTRVRFTGSFPMNSGVFVGEIDAYAVMDASVRLDVPGWSGTSIALTGTNILDHRHREFVGAPDIGRLLLLQLKREF